MLILCVNFPMFKEVLFTIRRCYAKSTFTAARALVGETIDKYNGKFLLRGPIINVIEGNPFKFLAIVEFNSTEEAETWFYSEENKKHN